MKLHPLSWNFSSCPPDEIPFLFCYEFSRELQWIRASVDFIRHGQMKSPSYWSPMKEFGWLEWPLRPYLWVPPIERQERLAELLLPNPAADVIRVIAEQPLNTPIWERYLAIAAQAHPDPAQLPKKGRKALSARYHDQLRMLSVYRLRQQYSPKEVYEALRSQYRKIAYTSPKNLSQTLRTFDRHLCAFYLKARFNIDRGLWFPPFGRHLIEP